MSCVLDILSLEDLLTRKKNLLKQLKNVDDEIEKRNKEINTKKIKNIKINMVKIK